MKNKHKKKRTIQIQEATKPETNSSTAETKFDAATKMQSTIIKIICFFLICYPLCKAFQSCVYVRKEFF